MPWSKTPKGGFISKTGGSYGTQQALDDLRPAAERTVRTTTVTGGRGSSSDEENFLDTGVPEEQWDGGIRKGVTTTVVTEMKQGKPEAKRSVYAYGSSQAKSNKRRSLSLGQDSDSTLGDEGRKPVGPFNPFQ